MVLKVTPISVRRESELLNFQTTVERVRSSRPLQGSPPPHCALLRGRAGLVSTTLALSQMIVSKAIKWLQMFLRQ